MFRINQPVWRVSFAGLFCALLSVKIAALDIGKPATVPSVSMDRWYKTTLVQTGEKVFRENCLECHGEGASGITADWRKLNEEGKYPPPPLDGTAHAWHHPIQVLLDTVAAGGAPLGGWMPAFGDKLNEEEVRAAIAYIQSRWSDAVYKDWKEMEFETNIEIEEFFSQ